MHAFHVHAGSWELMLHGNVFVQFLHESGEFHRRSQQAGSINWMMGAATRALDSDTCSRSPRTRASSCAPTSLSATGLAESHGWP